MSDGHDPRHAGYPGVARVNPSLTGQTTYGLADSMTFADRIAFKSLMNEVESLRTQLAAANERADRAKQKCEQCWDEAHFEPSEVRAILEYIHKTLKGDLDKPPAEQARDAKGGVS